MIESTPTETRNSKVTEENAQLKIVKKLELLNKTPMYWKFQYRLNQHLTVIAKISTVVLVIKLKPSTLWVEDVLVLQ